MGHQALMEEGRLHKFCLTTLSLVVQIYQGERRVFYGPSASSGRSTCAGIIAGCSHATTMLRIFLATVVASIVAKYSAMSLFIYVDDFSLTWFGTTPLKAKLLVQAAAMLVQQLENRGLKVSRGEGGKSSYRASSKKVLEVVVGGLNRLGLKHDDGPTRLGVEAGGQRFARRSLGRRFKAACARLPRIVRWLRAAGKMGASKLAKGVLGPQMAYGGSVVGTPDGLLKRQWAMMANALGRSAGQSLNLLLALGGHRRLDPIFRATLDPARVYLYKLWRRQLPTKQLAAAWREGQLLLGKPGTKARWGLARGPVTALILTLRRVGWELASPWKIARKDGSTICLRTVCPKRVLDSLTAAIEQWQSDQAVRSIPGLEVGQGKLWLDPLRELLGAHSPLSLMQRNALLAAVTRNTWPRARLVETTACRDAACTREGCTERDDEWHRIYGCQPLLAEVLSEKTGLEEMRAWPGLIREAKRAGGNHPLFTRALMMEPMPPMPAETLQDHPLELDIDPNTPRRSGIAFGDGSLAWPRRRALARAAWAVLWPEGGEEDAEACQAEAPWLGGVLRGEPQSISKAGHLSLAMAVAHGAPPLVFYTDCSQLVLAWSGGLALAQRPNLKNADAWRFIAGVLGTRGWSIDQLEVKKTKGHAGKQHIEKGLSTPWQRRCNNLVDARAKQANRPHMVSDKAAESYEERRAWLKEVATHIAKATAIAMAQPALSKEEREVLEARKAAKPAKAGRAKRQAKHRHAILPADRGWFCAFCRRVARTQQSLTRLRATACASTLAAAGGFEKPPVTEEELDTQAEMALSPEEWDAYQAKLLAPQAPLQTTRPPACLEGSRPAERSEQPSRRRLRRKTIVATKVATTKSAMRAERVSQEEARLHLQASKLGHSLWRSGALVWCLHCAGWGETVARKLAKQCLGAAPSATLRLLKEGRHPRYRHFLDRPLPVALTQELAAKPGG